MLPRRASAFLVPVSAAPAHRQVQEYRCRGLSNSYDLGSLLRRLEVKRPLHIHYDRLGRDESMWGWGSCAHGAG
jgi:hypothetical protein